MGDILLEGALPMFLLRDSGHKRRHPRHPILIGMRRILETSPNQKFLYSPHSHPHLHPHRLHDFGRQSASVRGSEWRGGLSLLLRYLHMAENSGGLFHNFGLERLRAELAAQHEAGLREQHAGREQSSFAW